MIIHILQNNHIFYMNLKIVLIIFYIV